MSDDQLDLFGGLLDEPKPSGENNKKAKPPRPKRAVDKKLEPDGKKVRKASKPRKNLQRILMPKVESEIAEKGEDYIVTHKTDLHLVGWELLLFGDRGLIWAFAKDGLMWFTKGGEEVHYTEIEMYDEDDLMQLTERDCKIIKHYGLEPYEYMIKTKAVWADTPLEELLTKK